MIITTTDNTNEGMQSLRAWAKDELRLAQRQFIKSPSAKHWVACTRAMLVFQQVDWGCRSPSVDKVALLVDTDLERVSEWPDIICRATLGMTVNQALA